MKIETDAKKIVEELRAMGYDARLLSGETVTLPFYENYVPCGVPNDVGDVVKTTIAIPEELADDLSLYVLPAKGDSMIDCGIFDGDYLYVKPGPMASDGNIVLASVDNEMTVKVFFEDEDGNKWLVPQNDDYDPILLNDKLNVRILGRLVHTVHYVKSISFKDCKRRVAKSHKRMNAYISSEMEADHKQAWSKGGKTELANGQMLCEEYNRKKSDGKFTVINVHGDAKIDTLISSNQVFGETNNENSDDELREKINVVMNLISNNRHWFSIAKVLMLRGLVKDGDFKGAQERIESLYPAGLKYPIDYADLMRMNVGSFAGPINSWNTTDGPIKRQAEFKIYVTIAKKFDGLFSFK